MKKKLPPIFYFGNPLFEKDNLALRIIPFLEKKFPQINFVYSDPNENFPLTKILWLIDTVWGIKKVSLVEDIEKIENSPRFSAHDLDLGLYLKLYKKLGKIKKIKIIALPFQLSLPKAIQGAENILRKNFLKSS